MGTKMTPTAKQTALAAKLFNKIAATSKRHGCPLSRTTYREDMAWLELNAESRADVSKYIGLHITAKDEAFMTMRRW